ncbi:hypothetical protein RP20_CCG019097 [Aedes albopictus]|nr:hypothetical protein RP20_CCG019097 [Aedes albopictus]
MNVVVIAPFFQGSCYEKNSLEICGITEQSTRIPNISTSEMLTVGAATRIYMLMPAGTCRGHLRYAGGTG